MSSESPMDQPSIMDANPQLGTRVPQGGPPVQHTNWQPPKHELRFPGEDGGQSLAAWARRDLEAALQLLADRAQYITGACGAAIALRDGEHIICRASSGPSAPEVGSFLEASSGLSGESVRTRRVMLCDDADHDPRVNRESCRQMGIASFVVMPLVRDDGVVGIFELFGSTPHLFKERDILALQRMGDMVNTALDQVDHAGKSLAAGTEAKQAAGTVRPPTTQGEEEEEDVLCLDDDSVPAKQDPVARPLPAPAIPRARGEAVRVIPAPNAIHDQKPIQRPHSVHACASCGFPVSQGRSLCLDCEAAHENQFGSSSTAAPPGFLTSLSDEPEQGNGVTAWILTHKYLLGTIAVVGSTIAILLFR